MTRRAILDALAQEIAESGVGFSIQDVANRAGVTHRTVYNHFPTRQALNDAFAVHVEEALAARGLGAPPDHEMDLAKLGTLAEETFHLFARHEAHIRAYVLLMMASRAPAKVATDRTRRFAELLEKEMRSVTPESARLIAVALRMFISSTGFHVLTEHFRLSTAEAAAVSGWVTRTLLAAAKAGKTPRVVRGEDRGGGDDRNHRG
ncbi:MAG: TetR/AcrR family transcriptional regulator [Deltaproteobacteria bacterium]|nr:TetR/AcrR family transcriptional regulator [Deltaproteobacteria bacterium]